MGLAPKIQTQDLFSGCVAVYIFVVVSDLVHFAKIAIMDPVSKFFNVM
jgi:hypothetical protein